MYLQDLMCSSHVFTNPECTILIPETFFILLKFSIVDAKRKNANITVYFHKNKALCSSLKIQRKFLENNGRYRIHENVNKSVTIFCLIITKFYFPLNWR